MSLAQQAVGDLLDRSGLTKSEFARRARVSRALLDDYLKGARQPSVGQLQRLGECLGLRLEVAWTSDTPSWARPHDSMAPRPLSMTERGEVLERVVPIAMAQRRRVRGELEYPPFRSLQRTC